MADALGIYSYYDPNRAGWQAPPSDYSPEIAGMLDATDDPGAVIRALMAEAREVAKPQEQTTWEWFRDHPGLLSHRNKLPGRAQNDAQRQHVMERALEIYGRPAGEQVPTAWSRLPEQLQADMMNYATNKDGFRDNIVGPYEKTGVVGPGSGLYAAGKWFQSIPAAAYQGSHMLANAAGNVIDGQGGGVKTTAQAGEGLADAFGTFIAPVQAVLGMDAQAPTAWRRSRQTRQALDEEKTPWLQEDIIIDNRPQQRAAANLESRAGAQEDGEGLLAAYNVDDAIGKIPTRIVGGIMDDTLNPWWDGANISRLARQGKTAAAARGLALEHAPGILVGGYTTYAENEYDKLLKRLEEAQR